MSSYLEAFWCLVISLLTLWLSFHQTSCKLSLYISLTQSQTRTHSLTQARTHTPAQSCPFPYHAFSNNAAEQTYCAFGKAHIWYQTLGWNSLNLKVNDAWKKCCFGMYELSATDDLLNMIEAVFLSFSPIRPLQIQNGANYTINRLTKSEYNWKQIPMGKEAESNNLANANIFKGRCTSVVQKLPPVFFLTLQLIMLGFLNRPGYR